MRNRDAAALLTLALAALTARAACAAPSGTAEIEADRLRIDNSSRTAVFEGHVRAVYGRLVLTCERMEAVYDERGDVISLHARGGVTVVRGEARARAGSARLEAESETLVLEGAPVLVRGPSRLEGERIEVGLADGRIEVTGARGRFELGGGSR
ncbi:MAG: LptA/OstA family protein [Polyangia bacterium]